MKTLGGARAAISFFLPRGVTYTGAGGWGEAMGMGNKSTFLLVHGAWHGAWCYERVIPLLARA